MASTKHREGKLPVQRRLPVQQLSILEPIASTSLYPYLPEMIESLQVPQSEVGKWAGICGAVFSLTQAAFSIPWGRFSDQYGRKPAILLSLVGTMATNLMLGFSENLPMLIIARALAGAGNGNLGIIRTTVAEMVPFKELQPRAFSLMPLVWNIGGIFGPAIGGGLANPLKVKLTAGEEKSYTSLLEKFPYALPNIVCACIFLVSITVGALFLEETLETLQGRRDYGRILGQKITNLIKAHVFNTGEALNTRTRQEESQNNGENEPLLKQQRVDTDEEDPKPPEAQPLQPQQPPTWREVITKQAFINLVVYTLLAMHSMAFDQIVPVYMQHKPIGQEGSTPYEAPLRFAGGLGLDNFSIGLMSTGYGIMGMATQFLVFPLFARKYGVLAMLKIVACAFPLIYFITPFVALLPTTSSRVGCMLTVMVLKCICGIFAFPASAILITNSASSLRTLGTLNGIAIAVSAIGRAAGPALLGVMMTLGVKRGYIILPWWFLAATAVTAAIPVFWLVEGKGFGDDGQRSKTEEVEEDNDIDDGLEVQSIASPR